MSQKPSHIPLFPDAYHRDPTHLTTEEHGAYLLLLMAAWGTEDCSLPNDERRDRKSVVQGTRLSVRVELGGRCVRQKKKRKMERCLSTVDDDVRETTQGT